MGDTGDRPSSRSAALARLKGTTGAARSSRVPQPPPKHSAARSHEVNDKYMDDWEDAYEKLQQASICGSPSSSSQSAKPARLSGGVRKKWAPPTDGWQDTLPDPEPPAPRPQASQGTPDELEQLHAIKSAGSSSRSRPTAVAPRVNQPRTVTRRHSGTPNQGRFPPSVVPGFFTGPADPQGIVTDISGRPNICSSVDWAAGEVVIGNSDHALYAVDVVTGRLRRRLYTKSCGHTEWVTCVTHTSDGKVVSGGMDGKLCLWAVRGTTCTNLEGHFGSVSQAKLERSGGRIVSAGYDKTLKVWDVAAARGRLLSSLDGHQGPVLELETGPNGALLSGDRSGHVLVWDITTGMHSWRLKNIHRGHITSLAWYAEEGESSDVFMTGGQDGCLRVWDQRARHHLHTLELHVNDQGVGALSDILPPSPATSGKVVTSGADGTVRILDPRQSFRELHTVHVTNFIYSCAAAGGLALIGCGDGSLHVIDIQAGQTSYALGANHAAVRTIDAASDRLICSGDDGNVIIYHF